MEEFRVMDDESALQNRVGGRRRFAFIFEEESLKITAKPHQDALTLQPVQGNVVGLGSKAFGQSTFCQL